MTRAEIMKHIKRKKDTAPFNTSTRVLHLQMIKFYKELEDLSGAEFCRGTGLESSYGTEFSKMQAIAPELVAAGLDTNLID